jgi:hypothetical protein
VIFVHGLGGDPFATWWHDSDRPKESWPFWLAEEMPEVQAHCLEYEAAPANWLGPSLPLVERAQNVLAVLLGMGIGKRPIVFICHSLGGLVIKQMLRKTQDENIEAWHQLAKQIKAVVFLGTPHRGAKLADSLFRLGKYLGASPSERDLQTHNKLLKDLNEWFAGHVGGPRHRPALLLRDPAGVGSQPHCGDRFRRHRRAGHSALSGRRRPRWDLQAKTARGLSLWLLGRSGARGVGGNRGPTEAARGSAAFRGSRGRAATPPHGAPD